MPVTHAQAASALSERDPVLASLIAEVGPPALRPPMRTPFEALVRAIVYQQLAGAAAAAIHGRLVTALESEVTPSRIAAVGPDRLRSVGLSAAKAASIGDLAAKTLDGTVILDPRRIGRLSDDEVVARLSTVRGVGRWTAEMFLIFQLRRPDVWPTGDLGVRRGYSLAYGVAIPSPRQLELLGQRFRPYRTVAAWYCWRAVELYRAQKPSAVTA